MFPFFDQAWLQLVNVMILAACDTHAPAASHKSGSRPGSCQDCLHRTISPVSALYLKHDRPRKIPCLLFKITVDCVNITSLPNNCWKPRYFVIGIWTLKTPLLNNIFSWNFAVLSQIHPKTIARNFIRIHSALAFLSHTIYGVYFFPGHIVETLARLRRSINTDWPWRLYFKTDLRPINSTHHSSRPA